ncbi:MAG: sensor histidine kinase [Candidatus Thiodiazotropha sp.]
MTKTGPSLHQRVLRWLIVPLGLMSCVILVEVYYSANRSTERILDQMLISQAIGILEHAISTEGDMVHLEVIQKTTSGTVFYKVEGPDNSFLTGFSGLPNPPDMTVLVDNVPYFYNSRYRNGKIRLVALRKLVEGRDYNGLVNVYVGQHTDMRKQLVWESVSSSLLRLVLLIILAGILGWVAVTLGLKPLTRLERAIGRRSYDDMRPIDVVMPREVRNVVAALNDLLERLRESVERRKRFISNASHQLRTPVASLMAQTELALRKSERVANCGELKNINDRAIQMSHLINQLLSLARADSEDMVSDREEAIDLIRFTKQVTIEWLNEHHDPAIDLGFESDIDRLEITANKILMTELLTNLIDNANNYCPKGSLVTVRIERNEKHVILEVEDNGPGIPETDRERVLERFYRLHEDRTGTGLGLAIAKEVANRHHGMLHLLAPGSGQGLLVRLELPLK